MSQLLLHFLLPFLLAHTSTGIVNVAQEHPLHNRRVDKINDMIKTRLTHMLDKQAADVTEANFCKRELDVVKRTLEKHKLDVRKKLRAVAEARAQDQKARNENNTLTPMQVVDRNIVLKKSATEAVGYAKDMAINENWETSPAFGHLNFLAKRKVEVMEQPLLKSQKGFADIEAALATSSVAKRRIQAMVSDDAATLTGKGSQLEDQARSEVGAGNEQLISDSNSKANIQPPTESMRALTDAKYELKKEMESLANAERERELIHDRCLVPTSHRTTGERFEARQDEIGGLSPALDKLNDWKANR